MSLPPPSNRKSLTERAEPHAASGAGAVRTLLGVYALVRTRAPAPNQGAWGHRQQASWASGRGRAAWWGRYPNVPCLTRRTGQGQ